MFKFKKKMMKTTKKLFCIQLKINNKLKMTLFLHLVRKNKNYLNNLIINLTVNLNDSKIDLFRGLKF